MTLLDKTRSSLGYLESLKLKHSPYGRMTLPEIIAYNEAIATVQELVHSAILESNNARDLKPRIRTIYDLVCDSGNDSEWVAYSYCAGVLEKLLK